MRSFLRTLAFPIACALTGAAAALFVVTVNQAPAPACPAAPTIHIRHEMQALATAPSLHERRAARVAPPRVAPVAFVHPTVAAPARVAPVAFVHPTIAAPAPFDDPRSRLEVPAGAVRCVETGRCVVDLGFYQTLRRDPSLLAREAHILPSLKDGHMRGLKLYAIRSGSLPSLLGLKNGDLLTRLNGVPLDQEGGASIAGAVVGLIRDREQPIIRMDIERKGQPIAVSIDVASLKEALQPASAGH
ncbi:hypothetical protein [Nannocystis bainbridge]|uniref:PDZ domain-containing protein n=1 Tax=Nannocystis bainbridge TaxID=2995303 RepID=A0ABT5E5J8_9BACT|nr:hypothetical protein [Nannocystis bainbridge]MDC0720718.1 hypothetical protein [Nannocystis bainbridge]